IMLDRAGMGEAEAIGLFGDRQAVREIGCGILVARADSREKLNAELHDVSVERKRLPANIVPIGIILSTHRWASLRSADPTINPVGGAKLLRGPAFSSCCRTRRAECRAVPSRRDRRPRTSARFPRRGD